MNEALAWLVQIDSDWQAAALNAEANSEHLVCQQVAKCQQVVEKSIYALTASMLELGYITSRPKPEHYPERALHSLTNLPVAQSGIQAEMVRRIFLKSRRAEISNLCKLAPKLPQRGDRYIRNTEYPFHMPDGTWTAPAVPKTFNESEVRQYKFIASHMRASAHRILSGYSRSLEKQ